MPVINTNTSAQFAQDALKANAKVQTTAMQQLATGNRINAAKDDAAGLSIGQNMTSQVRGLNQAVRNVNDGINQLQTADGALVEVSNMLQRMRELAVQSSNSTNSDSQRSYLNNEFATLKEEISRISDNTTWNNARLFGDKTVSALDDLWGNSNTASGAVGAASGLVGIASANNDAAVLAGNAASIATYAAVYNQKLADYASAQTDYTNAKAVLSSAIGQGYTQANIGATASLYQPKTLVFQAGINAGQTISIPLERMDVQGLGLTNSKISTFAGAQGAITSIDASIEQVNSSRSRMGATMNQLSYSADNMINISTNIAASRSTIMDTDYATASAQLAKTQIISQAATAMLTQANQQPQSVLALLKG